MTYAEFRDNWMRPGYSQKAGKLTVIKSAKPQTAQDRMEARLPIGEKGIGRLAAGRLGDVLHVWTRKSDRRPWLHVPFNWDDFDEMNTPLDQVLVQPDYNTPPPIEWPATGTILEIRQLTLNWAGRVPGRRVAGRHTSRVGRLRQDLELVMSPLAATQQEFEIDLESDLDEHEAFVGPITPAHLQLLDYQYDFEITWDKKRGVKVATQIRRAEDFAEEVGQETVTTQIKYYGRDSDPEQDPMAHPGTLTAGPIQGTMYYAARKGTSSRLQTLGIQPGVHVYRDGIRVEPYGDPTDDWLGVQARKASRQGYAAIRPNLLYGFVQISKIENPDLIDMTNRQGLVENAEYEEFVAHMRAEFRRFADVVFEEFVKPEWARDEQRAQDLAAITTSDRDVLIRDIVHDLRQPIAALGTELRNLDFVLDTRPMPAETKAHIIPIRDRANKHLEDIAETVRVALEDRDAAKIEPVSVLEVVEDARRTIANLAATHQATVNIEVGDRIVLAKREYLRRAIAELLRNGIQARRAKGTAPVVTVSSESRDGRVLLLVRDNGLGVSADIGGKVFVEPISLKGRQGEGLISVRDLLATFGAQVRLLNPGAAGAEFEIAIPSMGEVRKLIRR